MANKIGRISINRIVRINYSWADTSKQTAPILAFDVETGFLI